MAKKLFRILPLAVAMMGVLTVPVLAVHGGGGGGFRGGGGGGFRAAGFRGGMGMHGGHGFHGGDRHFNGRHHGHHRDHRRFRNFNQSVFFGGYGGYGGYYPYANDYASDYGGMSFYPVAPATPVSKGYSTYYSADGYYNYPRFYNPGSYAAPTQVIVNACCPERSARKYPRRSYKKSKPCPTQPSSVAERVKARYK